MTHYKQLPLQREITPNQLKETPSFQELNNYISELLKTSPETCFKTLYDVASPKSQKLKAFLQTFQADAENRFGPNIVHIYPMNDDSVNKDIWGTHQDGYDRIVLNDHEHLSIVWFHPNTPNGIVTTPPHSHNCDKSISSTSPNAGERSIPVEINVEIKTNKTTLVANRSEQASLDGGGI